MKRVNWLVVYRVTLVTLLAVIAWQAVKLGGTVSRAGSIWTVDSRSR